MIVTGLVLLLVGHGRFGTLRYRSSGAAISCFSSDVPFIAPKESAITAVSKKPLPAIAVIGCAGIGFVARRP